jgi:PAS domain S-box-containing protein
MSTLDKQQSASSPLLDERTRLQQRIEALEREQERLHSELAARSADLRAINSLVDHSMQAMLIFQDERFVFVNATMCELTGYRREELLAMGHNEITRLLHPDEQERVWSDTYRRLAGEPIPSHYEHRTICKDGSVRWLEIFADIIQYRGRPAMQAVMLDVTERLEAEERLREEEATYRSMFEKNRAVKLVLEPETGAIVDANPAASEFYGYPRDTLRTMNIADINILPPEQIQAEMQQAHAEQRLCFFFQHRLASGNIRDVEVYSGPIEVRGRQFLFSIIQDITERKQAEQERDRFFQLSLELLCIAGFDGYFKRLNPAWERTLGYTCAELLAEPFLNFIHPDDREPTMSAARYGKETRSLIALENRYRCKDGSYRWFSWSFTVLPEQEIVYGVARDITEHKQAEQVRQMRMRQTVVREERSRLARELHDSVTQSLYSMTLLAEGCRYQAANDTLSHSEQHFARLGSIANTALREMRLLIYQLRPPVLEREGLIGALQQRLETVERRSGMDALLDVEGELHLTSSMEEHIYWIIHEALNNALKHAAATTVAVHLKCLSTRSCNCPADTGEQAALLVEIYDNGHGFDQHTAQPGLGLVSMRERAEHLGGTLEIHSISGEDAHGTVVSVYVGKRASYYEPD